MRACPALAPSIHAGPQGVPLEETRQHVVSLVEALRGRQGSKFQQIMSEARALQGAGGAAAAAEVEGGVGSSSAATAADDSAAEAGGSEQQS